MKKIENIKSISVWITVILALGACVTNIFCICSESRVLGISSAIVALVVTLWGLADNVKLQSEVTALNDALQVEKDSHGKIVSLTMDPGEF